MPLHQESAAVAVARTHVEAWSNHDFDTARRGLAADVKVTVTTTKPVMPDTNTAGVDDYMQGLQYFGKTVVPWKRQNHRQHRRRPQRPPPHLGRGRPGRRKDDPAGGPPLPHRLPRPNQSRTSRLPHPELTPMPAHRPPRQHEPLRRRLLVGGRERRVPVPSRPAATETVPAAATATPAMVPTRRRRRPFILTHSMATEIDASFPQLEVVEPDLLVVFMDLPLLLNGSPSSAIRDCQHDVADLLPQSSRPRRTADLPHPRASTATNAWLHVDVPQLV